jgi:endonuclease YncB( thermonuclease family)
MRLEPARSALQPTLTKRNKGKIMAVPYYKAIAGEFVLLGKAPDGDSVRFIADDLDAFDELHRSYRIKPSRADNSVQLRFEAVDTPEVHYGAFAQPMGDEARDAMLQQLGFTNVGFGDSNGDTVTSSSPERLRGAILSKAADANGRPISYVLSGDDAHNVQDGEWIFVGKAVLQKTINWFLLEQGHAYYTVYTSTPRSHRTLLKPLAEQARQNKSGVWEIDDSSDFILEDHESIGADGSLVLPKLFRRCTDYLKAVESGFVGELTDWLRANASGARSENDQVLLAGVRGPVPFSTLIDQRNRRISLEADILSMTFVEK